MVTEQKITSTIEKMKSADPSQAHYLEDTLYRSLLADIAKGEVKSIRTARKLCKAALDSEKVLTFRYYPEAV